MEAGVFEYTPALFYHRLFYIPPDSGFKGVSFAQVAYGRFIVGCIDL
jgi:hypothetical protein